MQFNFVASVVFVIVFLSKKSFSQVKKVPRSPCPDKFQYIRSGNERIGLITIADPHFGTTKLQVELSQKGTEYTTAGQLILRNEDRVSEIIDDEEPLTYKVIFPLPNVIPRITSIKVDDFEICPGRPYSRPSTNITLKHRLNVIEATNNDPAIVSILPEESEINYLRENDDSNSELSFIDNGDSSVNLNYGSVVTKLPPTQPFSSTPTTTASTQNTNNAEELEFTANAKNPFLKKFQPISINLRSRNPPPPAVIIDEDEPEPTTPTPMQFINSICGRENVKKNAIKLNINGEPIASSRFPWIVAIFKKTNDDRQFQCGGSLISTKTVVSAAHCFFDGLETLPAEKILVSLGRHNLSNWSEMEAFNVDAERIITHPDFQPRLSSYDADLALIHLKQSVVFTNSIKPVCLWLGNTDPREIENVSGIIIGWGSDGRHRTTTIPTLVNATVVSRISCVRSNRDFISRTSDRTLCAGNLDGSGPCTGDSGNGLMIRHQNKWMLRGTVSAAVGIPTRPCILDQYGIYSDTAMFNEWIESNMIV